MSITKTSLSFPLSIKENKWQLKPYDERQVMLLHQDLDLPEILCRILNQRGITLEYAESFLNPTLKNLLPDPSHLLDMDKATERLVKAIENEENIVVFGDYDVDGATSAASLIRFFRMLGVEIKYYIPDRAKEGYGPNITALKRLKKEGADIVITVDCGTNSHEELAEAKKAGLDVIVVDHHLGSAKQPDAIAVINPNRLDETSPYRYLAAVGVTYLLIIALNRKLRENDRYKNGQQPDLLSLLDLVALGTICDVVPLKGVNRAFVAQGLKIMAQRMNNGLAALADIARLEEPPGVYHAGFLLGPRINAGGRVGKSDLGTILLSTEEKEEAENIARELDVLNSQRQTIEALVLDEAMIAAEKLPADASFICLARKGWHQGVIGIVAGRIKERFGKPVAVIALENGIGKASARSISGIDIGSAVTEAKLNGILSAGGGHAMAAGFSIEEGKIPEFINFMEEKISKKVKELTSNKVLNIDGFLSLSGISPELIETLMQIGPFGMGNPEPLFAIMDAKIVKSDVVGENHVRCILADAGVSSNSAARLKAMAFRERDTELGDKLLNYLGKNIHIAGKIRINSWQGRNTPELLIEDVVLA